MPPTPRTSLSIDLESKEIIERAHAACILDGDRQTRASWTARAVKEQAAREDAKRKQKAKP